MKLIVNEAIQMLLGWRTGEEAAWDEDGALSIREGKHTEFGR